jgi:hypothetical protein
MDMGRHRHGPDYPLRPNTSTGNPYNRNSRFGTLVTNPLQERLDMAKLQNIIFRIFALFGSSALAAVAGGALIGVDLWKSAALAGIMACAQVIEKLLRFSVDGSLTKEEIEIAFTGAVKAKPEVAE